MLDTPWRSLCLMPDSKHLIFMILPLPSRVKYTDYSQLPRHPQANGNPTSHGLDISLGLDVQPLPTAAQEAEQQQRQTPSPECTSLEYRVPRDGPARATGLGWNSLLRNHTFVLFAYFIRIHIYIPSSLNSYSCFTKYVLLQRLHDMSEGALGWSPLKLFCDFGKATFVSGSQFLLFQKNGQCVQWVETERWNFCHLLAPSAWTGYLIPLGFIVLIHRMGPIQLAS